MDLLVDFYRELRAKEDLDSFPKLKVWIPYSWHVYIAAGIKAKLDVDVSWAEIEKLLYDEGLYPAERYEIPAWYRAKWLKPPVKPDPPVRGRRGRSTWGKARNARRATNYGA